MQNFKHTSLVILLALSLQGCQYFKDIFAPVFQRPQVTVKDVQVVSINSRELTLKIKFLVQNPNNFSLEFSHLNYQVSLNKRLIGYGEHTEKIELAAEGNSELNIPLSIQNNETAKVLRELMKTGEKLRLELKGWVDFHSVLGTVKIDFEHNHNLL
jgi:LEA14-like dessication related protein